MRSAVAWVRGGRGRPATAATARPASPLVASSMALWCALSWRGRCRAWRASGAAPGPHSSRNSRRNSTRCPRSAS
eukprot:4472134-Lingulodinium_polyedra.AAC.1